MRDGIFKRKRLLVLSVLAPLMAGCSGTAEMLHDLGVPCQTVGKSEQDPASAVRAIEQGQVDLVINIPRTYDAQGRPDGYAIRRAAIDGGVPLFTDPQLARTVIEMLHRTKGAALALRPMTDYASRAKPTKGRRPRAIK